MLKYWERTYHFIKDCVTEGGKVLVHCKMGISRSAATVIAFGMKYYQWSLSKVMNLTKEKRPIVKPNQGFMHQLIIYEGILEASSQRHSFRNRSKSDSSSYRKSGDHRNLRKPVKQASFNMAKESLLRNLDLKNSCIKSHSVECVEDSVSDSEECSVSVKQLAKELETKLTDSFYRKQLSRPLTSHEL